MTDHTSTLVPDISNLTAVELGLLLASDQSLDLVPGLDGEPGHLMRNGRPRRPRKRSQPQGSNPRGTQPFPYEREMHKEPSSTCTDMRQWFDYGASRQHKLTTGKGRAIMTRIYDRGSIFRRYQAAGMLGKTWAEAVENAGTFKRQGIRR